MENNMKNETFLGTIYGIDICCKTTDEVKVKLISKYLEEAREALMFNDLSIGYLHKTLNENKNENKKK
jgi:hypothetical protein